MYEITTNSKRINSLRVRLLQERYLKKLFLISCLTQNELTNYAVKKDKAFATRFLCFGG